MHRTQRQTLQEAKVVYDAEMVAVSEEELRAARVRFYSKTAEIVAV